MSEDKYYINRDLLLRAKNGDEGAMAEIIEKSKRVVYKYAIDYYKIAKNFSGVSVEDLQQDFILAIYDAVDTYDISRINTVKFTSWLHWCIKKVFRDSVWEKYNCVHVYHRDLFRDSFAINNTKELEFLDLNCKDENYMDIDRELDIENTVNKLFIVLNEDKNSVSGLGVRNYCRNGKRTVDMIKMFYGISGYAREYSLKEIGEKYGVTHQAVDYVIKTAFAAIRKAAEPLDSMKQDILNMYDGELPYSRKFSKAEIAVKYGTYPARIHVLIQDARRKLEFFYIWEELKSIL